MKPGIKQVVTIGAGGAVGFLGADYAVSKLYTLDNGTEDPSVQDPNMKRGGIAIAGGIALGLALRKTNRDLALGLAAGACAAGVRRLDMHYHWTSAAPATAPAGMITGLRHQQLGDGGQRMPQDLLRVKVAKG